MAHPWLELHTHADLVKLLPAVLHQSDCSTSKPSSDVSGSRRDELKFKNYPRRLFLEVQRLHACVCADVQIVFLIMRERLEDDGQRTRLIPASAVANACSLHAVMLVLAFV